MDENKNKADLVYDGNVIRALFIFSEITTKFHEMALLIIRCTIVKEGLSQQIDVCY